MSTLTRTNSHTKKPQYKDYVSFLDNYRHGKKDDQSSVITSDSGVNFSLTNSSNNSSNSVFSDVSDGRPNVDNFNNKKHTTANSETYKPTEQKHAVKTEVFIEIKSPAPTHKFATQVFEVQNVNNPQDSTISVSNAAKIFEKSGNKSEAQNKGAHPLQPKQSFSKKLSIGEISKKFEDNSQSQNVHKSPPKRAASIGEVSKIFENNCNTTAFPHRPKNFNAVPKPFNALPLPKLSTEVKINPVSQKPAILSPKPVIAVPQFPKYNHDSINTQTDSVDSAFSSLSISPSPPQSVSPPPPPVTFSSSSGPSSPPPPPLPPVTHSSSSGPSSPPPPPPPLPPSNNVIFKTNVSVKSPSTQNGISNPRPAHNGLGSPQPIRNGIKVQTSEVPQQNGGTLNRNDPRVKKAVYGALRNMYGAYHDQANDYLATLPKNRVKKNNGLDSIINSIASQGGLDKLNGRANPKVEME